MDERIRRTVSIEPEVYEAFRRLAEASGVSVSRAMGDWLRDTVGSAQKAGDRERVARMAVAVRVLGQIGASSV